MAKDNYFINKILINLLGIGCSSIILGVGEYYNSSIMCTMAFLYLVVFIYYLIKYI